MKWFLSLLATATMRRVTLTLLCLACLGTHAQNFRISGFEESLLDVISTSVKDKNGKDCAVIKFSTQDKGFSVDNAANSFENIGDLYVYVPEGTETLTIRHRVHRTLFYRIPIHIQSGCHYVASIDIIDTGLIGKVDPDKFPYVDVGLNVIPFAGPSLAIGYNIKAFCAELGFTYGLNKTEDMYYYGVGAAISSAYNYHALRVALRLGYAFALARQLALTPQAGIAYNYIHGKGIDGVSVTENGFMDRFNTLSATAGAKLSFNFNAHLGLSVTPEYDFAVAKDGNYDVVKDSDSKLKAWTEGFCLSVALTYKF